MKHYRIYRAVLMALIVTAAAACSSELTDTEGTQPQPVEPGEQITVIATQQTEDGQKDSPQTRVNYDFLDNGTVTVTWAEKDILYVGNNIAAKGSYITDTGSGFKSFNLNSGQNTKSGAFAGPLPDNTSNGDKLYAIYGNGNDAGSGNYQILISGNAVTFNYTQQCQKNNGSTSHLAGYDFMTATATYTKGETSKFTFKRLGAMMKFVLTLPNEAKKVENLYLSSFLNAKMVFSNEIKWTATTTATEATNCMTLGLSNSVGNLMDIEGEVLTAYMMVAPTALAIAGQEIMLAVMDQDDKLYTAILKGSEIEAGKCYTVTRTLTPAFAGGSGTEADPYQISTAEQLHNLSRLVNTTPHNYSFNNKYYQLTTDIDLKDEPWTPIGYSSKIAFKGHFSGKLTDGQAPTISGLSIANGTYYERNGLFGYVLGGSISDINIGGSITADSHIGSIAGSISEGTTLENCTSTCTITTTTGYVGGIVGIINGNATLKNCKYTGNATAGIGGQPGGIVGYINIGSNKTVTLIGCSSTPTETIIGLINPNGDSSNQIIIKKDESDTGVTLPGNSGGSYPPIKTPSGGAGDYNDNGDMFSPN